MRGALIQHVWCPYTEGNLDTGTDRYRKNVVGRHRELAFCKSKDAWDHRSQGRGRGRVPNSPQEEPALHTPRSGTASCRMWDIKFLLSKALGGGACCDSPRELTQWVQSGKTVGPGAYSLSPPLYLPWMGSELAPPLHPLSHILLPFSPCRKDLGVRTSHIMSHSNHTRWGSCFPCK